MKTLSDLLTEEQRAAIRAPLDVARTLPRTAFIDQDFYDLEVRYALLESWIAISFTSSVSGSGDIAPVTVLGQPLLLVRGSDGKIRTFYNVCPYDSCEISIGS